VSFVRRIAAVDQTVVVVAEDDHVAVLLFFGDACAEDSTTPTMSFFSVPAEPNGLQTRSSMPCSERGRQRDSHGWLT
jgi:hypothetical protein